MRPVNIYRPLVHTLFALVSNLLNSCYQHPNTVGNTLKGESMYPSSKCALLFSGLLLIASTASLANTQGYLNAKQKISNEIVSCLKNGGMEGKAALNECYYDAAMSFSKLGDQYVQTGLKKSKEASQKKDLQQLKKAHQQAMQVCERKQQSESFEASYDCMLDASKNYAFQSSQYAPGKEMTSKQWSDEIINTAKYRTRY